MRPLILQNHLYEHEALGEISGIKGQFVQVT